MHFHHPCSAAGSSEGCTAPLHQGLLQIQALRSTRLFQAARSMRKPSTNCSNRRVRRGDGEGLKDLRCVASVEPLGPSFYTEAREKDDRLNATPGPAPCRAALCFNCSAGMQEIAQCHSSAFNHGLVTP